MCVYLFVHVCVCVCVCVTMCACVCAHMHTHMHKSVKGPDGLINIRMMICVKGVCVCVCERESFVCACVFASPYLLYFDLLSPATPIVQRMLC